MSKLPAMLSTFAVTFPFFALVLCGFLATFYKVLPVNAIAGLNTFVLFFALPCMLFRFGAQTPLEQLLDPVLGTVYLLCGLAVITVTLALTLRRWGWNDAAFGALVAAFPNSGFMGVPLLVALLGEASAGIVILTVMLDMVLTTSLCIALSRLGQQEGSAWRTLRLSLKSMALNPMPWAIGLGALASGLALDLPVPLQRTIAMLADAASPVALFAIGAVLARSQLQPYAVSKPHVLSAANTLVARDYVAIALIKLLLHPLLVWLACQAVLQAGGNLSPLSVAALVLVAALPSASNVSLLAERFDAHGGRIARIILVSTTLAFLSFSATVALLT